MSKLAFYLFLFVIIYLLGLLFYFCKEQIIFKLNLLKINYLSKKLIKERLRVDNKI